MKASKPPWQRWRARWKGEISAEKLEAYRRAGVAAYTVLDELEHQRFLLQGTNVTPWSMPLHQQATLCAWNAFILQSMGDAMLDADARADQWSAGYVPEVTYQQAENYYGQVAMWLSHAARARHTPDYRLPVVLPATLPEWSPVEPCPPEHLVALMEALERAFTHLNILLNAFEALVIPEAGQPQLARLQGIHAALKQEVSSLISLYGGPVSPELHEEIEERARWVMEESFLLGQFLAMPGLLEVEARQVQLSHRRIEWRAGEAPWQIYPFCLSDPRLRDRLAQSETHAESLQRFWSQLTSPDEAHQLALQINTLLEQKRITYATQRQHGIEGRIETIPYGALYAARLPLDIGGQIIRPGEVFATVVVRKGNDYHIRACTGPFGADFPVHTSR